MPGLRSISKLVDPSRAPFRFQVAAYLTVTAVALAFIAVKFQTETYLLASPASRSPQSYSRIWFIPQDILTGANLAGGVLRVDRLPRESSEYERTWEIPVGAGVHWTVAKDLSYAAWIDGPRLHTLRLSDERRSSVQLPAKVPMGISMLPDGSVAVVFGDASVSRWDLNSNQPLGEIHLSGLDTADQAALLDDYIAIASHRVHAMALYHLRNGAWFSMESISEPEAAFQLTIPAAGKVATISEGHLRMGKMPRKTSGAVSSAVEFRGVMVVTGDFEKILALGDADHGQPPEDYGIASAPAHSVIAAGRDHLAVSDAQGTSILNASIHARLSPFGQVSALLAVLEILGAGLLLMSPWLFHRLLEHLALRAQKQGKAERAGMILQSLPAPPLPLAELLAAGKGVLWAGAGLSAQSGLPVRQAFAENLLHAAQLEEYIRPSVGARLRGRVSRGETEAALEVLLERMPSSKFSSYADAILPHFLTPSRSHELLGKLPITAAFTTNYDDLLSMLEVPWNSVRLTARGQNVERAVHSPFLLKWYGNLTEFQTLVMTCPQLTGAALESRAANLFAHMLQSRCVVFVGASLEGIKADLEALHIPKKPAGKHYVITGVSDAGWKGLANELSELYGIEALVCSEHRIGTELPLFLEKLVESVAHARPALQPVARAQ